MSNCSSLSGEPSTGGSGWASGACETWSLLKKGFRTTASEYLNVSETASKHVGVLLGGGGRTKCIGSTIFGCHCGLVCRSERADQSKSFQFIRFYRCWKNESIASLHIHARFFQVASIVDVTAGRTRRRRRQRSSRYVAFLQGNDPDFFVYSKIIIGDIIAKQYV